LAAGAKPPSWTTACKISHFVEGSQHNPINISNKPMLNTFEIRYSSATFKSDDANYEVACEYSSFNLLGLTGLAARAENANAREGALVSSSSSSLDHALAIGNGRGWARWCSAARMQVLDSGTLQPRSIIIYRSPHDKTIYLCFELFPPYICRS
jgi:hypothetical protein